MGGRIAYGKKGIKGKAESCRGNERNALPSVAGNGGEHQGCGRKTE